MNPLGFLARFFSPPPAAPRLPDAAVQRLYPRFRWQALEATFIGYALYYLVRNNVPIVTVELKDSLGYSKEMVGNLGAVTALTYGLSKFIMGSVSDRSDPRRFMSVGLLLTAMCNFAFGSTTNYPAVNRPDLVVEHLGELQQMLEIAHK